MWLNIGLKNGILIVVFVVTAAVAWQLQEVHLV